MAPRLAFLSTEDLTDFVCDDALAAECFLSQGVEVDTLAWQSPTDWAAYDAVLIRSTWDYQRHPEPFLQVLRTIDKQATLLNPVEVVQWNMHKRYLLELQAQGVPIVPTRLTRGLFPATLDRWRQDLDASELIVKPAIGASADDTFRLPKDLPEASLKEICDCFVDREALVQPFLQSIEQEGEFSLFFFAGALSHSIQKIPKQGDFRVQEEHGGDIRALPYPDADLVQAAQAAVRCVPQPLLYARVDLVRDADGSPRLMELELIEPALYFRTDADSAQRFTQATLRWLQAGPQ